MTRLCRAHRSPVGASKSAKGYGLDNTRYLIAFLFATVVVLLYPVFVNWLYPPAAQPKPGARQSSGAPAAVSAPTATTPRPKPGLRGGPWATLAPAGAASAGEGLSLQTITVSTSLYRAVLRLRGGRLSSFVLRRLRQTASPDSPGYEMVAATAEPAGGLVVQEGGKLLSDREIVYRSQSPGTVELAAGAQADVVLVGAAGGGLRLSKSFSFRDGSYVVGLSAGVEGGSQEPAAVGFSLGESLLSDAGSGEAPELAAEVNSKVLAQAIKGLKADALPQHGTVAYAGFGDRYFLEAFVVDPPRALALALSSEDAEASALSLLDPGASRLSLRLFMGPKELHLLEQASPELRHAINFGWAWLLALVFVKALVFFHGLAPNYGVDILLLTVVLRLVSFPLSIRAQRSMTRLQRLQPQMQRLREKFKDDAQRLNREMMDLYKRNHVNPVGGCLPTLLQLPIFVGLYEALASAVELRHAPFVGWINDLSAPECLPLPFIPPIPLLHCQGLPVLVLLMGASTFLQQWMMPASPDPNQQRMMMLTPIIFTFMFINLPAGLSLYYFASNVLGIVQQFFLNREIKRFTPATA